MIRTKSGRVRFKEITPALIYILQSLNEFQWMMELPKELVITSVNDSVHTKNSRHYSDEAIDLRSHNFKDLNKEEFRKEFNKFLGTNKFTVLLENQGTPNEHFHIQVKKGIKFP